VQRRALLVLFVGSIAAAYAIGACARGVTGGTASLAAAPPLPAGATTVQARLGTSPRHGEWAMIRTGPDDSVRAWVVFPERSTKAPVVVVVHEIFGLSTWVRGVADQMAANGYIAIAPDLLTGKAPLEGDTLPNSVATAAIRTLRPDDVHRQLEAVGRYGMSLPAALPRYGIVGFCWGGGTSFAHAVRSPMGLGAAVVYYGPSPDTVDLARVRVPVLGLYAGDDQRINARVPATDSIMRRLGKPYDVHFFDGAGHGFLRAQEGREANRVASERAWPLTIAFFRRHLGA
jgi:carboxymethylenebutenolidase